MMRRLRPWAEGEREPVAHVSRLAGAREGDARGNAGTAWRKRPAAAI